MKNISRSGAYHQAVLIPAQNKQDIKTYKVHSKACEIIKNCFPQ